MERTVGARARGTVVIAALTVATSITCRARVEPAETDTAGVGADAEDAAVPAVPAVPWTTIQIGDCDVPPELIGLAGGGGEFAWLQEGELLEQLRLELPELFAPTAPPPYEVRLPGEFEPASALMMAYHGIVAYDDMFVAIVDAAMREGEVLILVDAADRDRLHRLLTGHGIPLQAVSIIDDIPVDGVWIRDFGPRVVQTPGGQAVVDARFFSNCLYSDAVPTQVALRSGNLPVFRPPLFLEGGDLLSNGAGLCLTTTATPMRSEMSQVQFADLVRAFYGCRQTVFLTPLLGEAVEHVDMFATFAAEDVVLLGEYAVDIDPGNHVVLEMNDLLLSGVRTEDGRPLTVVRLPMADSLLPPLAPFEARILRSHVNLTVFNGVVLVPVYGGDPAQERAMLDIIAAAFPGRRVVPLRADEVAVDYGAIHCFTITMPVPWALVAPEDR